MRRPLSAAAPARRALLAGLFAAALLPLASCRDAAKESANRSATEVRAHVTQAREGLGRMTTGFLPVLEGLAPSLAQPIGANNAGNVRYELMGMGTRQVPAGTLAFYPTSFVAAIDRSGNAIARDVAEPDDRMRGMPMANLFPAVRQALAGTAGLSIGELPATADQPSRVFLVAATPVRDPQGAVIGALTAGLSYGQIARALERAVRTHAGQQPVIWVALQREARVLPSGRDKDVPARWLIPQSLITQIPRDADARLRAGGGQHVWTFVENERRGWAGAVATLPQLEGTNVLIFRSEAEQR